MRTTLSLDDDVSALLERVRKARKASFKTVVNQALREGLRSMIAPRQRRKSYRTPSVSLGRSLVALDDVADALAVAEGESFQ